MFFALFILTQRRTRKREERILKRLIFGKQKVDIPRQASPVNRVKICISHILVSQHSPFSASTGVSAV